MRLDTFADPLSERLVHALRAERIEPDRALEPARHLQQQLKRPGSDDHTRALAVDPRRVPTGGIPQRVLGHGQGE